MIGLAHGLFQPLVACLDPGPLLSGHRLRALALGDVLTDPDTGSIREVYHRPREIQNQPILACKRQITPARCRDLSRGGFPRRFLPEEGHEGRGLLGVAHLFERSAQRARPFPIDPLTPLVLIQEGDDHRWGTGV